MAVFTRPTKDVGRYSRVSQTSATTLPICPPMPAAAVMIVRPTGPRLNSPNTARFIGCALAAILPIANRQRRSNISGYQDGKSASARIRETADASTAMLLAKFAACNRDRPVVLTRQVTPKRGTKQNPCLSASLRKRKPSVKAPRAGSKPPRSSTRSRLTRAVPERIQLSILRRRLRTCAGSK